MSTFSNTQFIKCQREKRYYQAQNVHIFVYLVFLQMLQKPRTFAPGDTIKQLQVFPLNFKIYLA